MGSFSPINLRVDRGSERAPVIIRPNPIFSWGFRHEDAARKQAAYRIFVTDFFDEHHLFWDSDWIKTGRQEAVYAGKPLCQGHSYAWQVILLDDDGSESDLAEGRFSAPLFDEWKAPWIAPAEDFGKAAIYFRKDFKVKKALKNAALFVCGIGYQSVTVNGELLDSDNGQGLLEPVFSDYTHRCYYSVLPVADLLEKGDNALGIVVANGWRHNIFDSGKYEVDHTETALAFMGKPQLTAQLMLEYADGKVEWVLTDESWFCGKGGTTYADVFNGEHFDRRLEPFGFDCPHFEDEGFAPVVCVPAPGGKMLPATLEPITEQAYLAPQSIHFADGKYLVDFGTNIAGWVKLCLGEDMEEGQTVIICHAEELDNEVTLHTANLRSAEQKDIYISDGEPDTWSPRFTYHGFRYVTVEGLPGLDESMIFAVNIHNDVHKGSYFRCGSAILNAIQEIVVQTEKDNMHHILTDCPQRDERQGWMNDATVRFEETPYNFDAGRFFPKIIGDLMDIQREDGAITCTAPYVWGSRPADPVCSSFLVAGMGNLLHNGDMETLRTAYPAFKAWNECLAKIAAEHDGIVEYSLYGDWAGPGDCCVADEDAHSKVTPGELMSTGYHYYNYRLLAQMAGYLGLEDEVKAHEKAAEAVQKAFLKKYWHSDTGVVATGSQACQAFALWLGILPESDRQTAAEKMRRAVIDAGMRLTTGNLCTRYLIDMLAAYGEIDMAYELMTKEDYPSWGYMLQNGATTVWERFEMKENGGMNSHNHPMYGAIGYWFYAYLAGVKPDAPGWEHFTVKPCIPQKLTFAEAKVDTVKGPVLVKWLKRYGKTHLTVDVPMGCTASIDFGTIQQEVSPGFHHFVL